MVGDTELAPELAMIDLLAGVGGAQADESGEETRIFNRGHPPDIAFDIGAHIRCEQVGQNRVIVVQVTGEPAAPQAACQGRLHGSGRQPSTAA